MKEERLFDDVNIIPTAEPMLSGKKAVTTPPLSMVGFALARLILMIISGFILLLAAFLIFNFEAFQGIDIPTDTQLNEATFEKRLELIKIVQEEKKNYREFILQLSQMILLNLLLPTLTAILGYIFAKGESQRTSS